MEIKIKLNYFVKNSIVQSFPQIYCLRIEKKPIQLWYNVMAGVSINVSDITSLSIIVKRAGDWNNERLQKSLTPRRILWPNAIRYRATCRSYVIDPGCGNR